jgi:tetratricopeptide (TPR) repeat protein
MAIKCPDCGYENEDGALACNLCQHIFPRKKQPEEPDFGRRFEGFARFTALNMAKEPMLSGLGIDLDYSPASLCGVDAAIDVAIGPAGEAPDMNDRDYDPDKDKQGVMLNLGSYYGEVCRRVLGGVWQKDPGGAEEFIMARMVFGDNYVYPIARAMRRFKNGAKFYFFLQFEDLAVSMGVSRKPWGRGFIKQAGLILDRGTLPLEKKAPVIKLFCKMALAYDEELSGDVLFLTTKISKLAPAAAPVPAPRPLPDKRLLMAASHILNGEIALNACHYSEAIGFFEEALKLDPLVPDTWKNLSVAQYGAGNTPGCIASIKRCCELDPADTDAWRFLADIMFKLERFSEQADCWRKIVEAAPQYAGCWRELGLACNRAGRFKESLDSLAKSLELAPENAEVRLERAVVLDRSGEREEALRQAEALFANPAHLAALKKEPLSKYACLITKEMSPELKKLITEKLG